MAGKTAILSLKIIGDATSAQKAAATTKKEISDIEKVAGKSKDALKKGGLVAGGALVLGMNEAIGRTGASAVTAASLGLSPEDAKAAGALSGKLYAGNFGGSIEEVESAISGVASSLAEMSDNGGADVERLSGKALNLATVMGTDVGEAINSAGILVNSGLAKNADEAFDLIAGSVTKVPKAMQAELLPVMDEYSQNFAALGIDGTTAFGIMTQAAKGGAIQMDKTGDALKEFTIRATDGSKASADAYKAIGLDAVQMAKDVAAGGDTAAEAFGKTVAGLQGIEDPAAQAQAAIGLFGTPLEDLGTSKIPEFLGAIDPAGDAFDSLAGSAEQMGATLAGSPSASLESFKRLASESFVQIAAAGIPVLQPLLDLLIQYAPILGPVALAIAAVAAVTWIVGAATSAYAAAVGIGTAAQWLWNAALNANPIGLVVLGIVLLIAALVSAYNNVGWFKDAVDLMGAIAVAVFESIVQWVTDVVTWLDGVLEPVGGIQGALEIMGGIAGTVFGSIIDNIKGMIGWIQDAIGWFTSLFGAKDKAANAPSGPVGNGDGGTTNPGARMMIASEPEPDMMSRSMSLMSAPVSYASASDSVMAGGVATYAPAQKRSVTVNATFPGLVTDKVGVAREIRQVLRDADQLVGA